MNRMRGRRQAVMQTRAQIDRKAVDEVKLDPDLFVPPVSWDWYGHRWGHPHRMRVIWRHSRRVFIFVCVAVFIIIIVVGRIIIPMILRA